MRRVAAYTSFTFTYLSRALVLAQSLRAAHPDWIICACIVDSPPPDIDCSAALGRFDRVIYATELDIPNFQSWIFKHDLVEACTAVKGHALSFLLAEGYDLVFYFDPDIAVFHGLDTIVARLDKASIVLTPHQAAPSADYGSSACMKGNVDRPSYSLGSTAPPVPRVCVTPRSPALRVASKTCLRRCTANLDAHMKRIDFDKNDPARYPSGDRAIFARRLPT